MRRLSTRFMASAAMRAGTMVRRCATDSAASTIVATGAANTQMVETVGPIPDLSFLARADILKETVPGTIDVCNNLLGMLKTCTSHQERHDILDSISNVLCLLLDPAEFVRQIHPNLEYKKAAMEAFTQVHHYMADLNSRRELYDELVTLSTPEAQAELTEESRKNVAQLKMDMERNGIHFPDDRRLLIADMNCEKEELAQQFIQLGEGRNPFHVLRHLLMVRHKLAGLLGFKSFAEQQLRGCMLDTPEKVWHFLCAVGNKTRPRMECELDLIRNNQGTIMSENALTDEQRLKVSNSIRAEYAADGIEEYMSVANCVRGIQILCSQVFGVELREVPMSAEENLIPTAKKYHVYHETEGFMGVIVLDLYARESKHCQAGHLTLQLGCRPRTELLKRAGLELPERQYPVVALTCNAGSLVRPGMFADRDVREEVVLMQSHEVVTMFHEFGHALHTIFGQTTVQNLAGTRGTIDFVETFSQLFELFLTSHDFVKQWAIKDGEPIPKDIIDRRNKWYDMFRASDRMDQIVLASVDQALHGPQPFTTFFPHHQGNLGKRTLGGLDDYGRGIFNFSRLLIDVATPITPIKPTERGMLRLMSFEHLASYPAAYYGYLYSGVFAQRIWDKFFCENPLNREEGERLRREVLQFGAAADQKEIMTKYLGEDMDTLEDWV